MNSYQFFKQVILFSFNDELIFTSSNFNPDIEESKKF